MISFEEFRQNMVRRCVAGKACDEGVAAGVFATDKHDAALAVKKHFDWVIRSPHIGSECINAFFTDEEMVEYGIYTRGKGWQVTDGNVHLCANAEVEIDGTSTVAAYDASKPTVRGNSVLKAGGSTTSKAYNDTSATLEDNAIIEAHDAVTVDASGNVVVFAYGMTKVKARGHVVIRAYEDVEVDATDFCIVEAFGNVKVSASGNVFVRLHDNATIVKAVGNVIIDNHTDRDIQIEGGVVSRNMRKKSISAKRSKYQSVMEG